MGLPDVIEASNIDNHRWDEAWDGALSNHKFPVRRHLEARAYFGSDSLLLYCDNPKRNSHRFVGSTMSPGYVTASANKENLGDLIDKMPKIFGGTLRNFT